MPDIRPSTSLGPTWLMVGCKAPPIRVTKSSVPCCPGSPLQRVADGPVQAGDLLCRRLTITRITEQYVASTCSRIPRRPAGAGCLSSSPSPSAPGWRRSSPPMSDPAAWSDGGWSPSVSASARTLLLPMRWGSPSCWPASSCSVWWSRPASGHGSKRSSSASSGAFRAFQRLRPDQALCFHRRHQRRRQHQGHDPGVVFLRWGAECGRPGPDAVVAASHYWRGKISGRARADRPPFPSGDV